MKDRTRLAVAAIATTIAACVDTSASTGVASISNLVLPSPSVVVGDVMRDSLGAPAKLTVVAYDGSGGVMTSVPVEFVVLGTSVTIDADGTAHGVALDSIGPRVIASVEGLQTLPVRIPVTARPERMSGGGTVTLLTFPQTTPTSNPADSIVFSTALKVVVSNAAGAAAQGVIVRYEIAQSPTPTGTLPTTVLVSDQRQPSARDTTDFKGEASRTIGFLHRRATGALVAGTATDTIVVRARASYAGVELPGSPALFKIPVRRQ